MLGGFWTSVTFLGENWVDQWHFVSNLVNLLLVVLLSAALLAALFRLSAMLWDKLAGKIAAADTDATSSQPDNRQE